MYQFVCVCWLFMINWPIISNGRESDFWKSQEMARIILSRFDKRQPEVRRMLDDECAPAHCKFNINMSALAANEVFIELVDNWDAVEALHIRFVGVHISPEYDKHRRAARAATTVKGEDGAMIDEAQFKNDLRRTSDGSRDWQVFDPLWWMWARTPHHYVFSLPLLDLDILSFGRIFIIHS